MLMQTLTRNARARAVSSKPPLVRYPLLWRTAAYSRLQTIYLPVIGLVDVKKLRPGDLVGVNKDSYLILDTLPSEYAALQSCEVF